MEKQLFKLTSTFLRMNRIILFLLIVFPITIRLYSSSNNEYPFFNFLLASIGGICLICWLHAIGHKANEKIVAQGFNLNSFRYFNLSLFILVVSYSLVFFLGTTIQANLANIKITYSSPIYLSIISLCSFLFATIIAAKTLVSAEKNKIVGIGQYFTTTIQLLIAPIGLWYVQLRIQKI